MAGATNILRNLKGDRVIWAIMFILALMSILVVYSATDKLAYLHKGGNTEYYLLKHSAILLFGFIIAYVAYSLPYQVYMRMAPWLILISVPLLIFTMAMGVDVNSAKRWLSVPGIGLTFQTSDFAKIALVVYVAKVITANQETIKDLQKGFAPVIIPVLVICGLIAPSDLSTAMILFVTAMAMMFVGRVRLSFLVTLMTGGIILFSFLVTIGNFFPQYVRVGTWIQRVRNFMTGGGDNFQVMQGKMAIANGQYFGVGPGNSIQRNFLPSSYADFIYAIIGEEYGLVGASFILLIYVVLMFRIARLVTKSPKAFGSILAVGLGFMIVLQAMANMAVSVNLLPVTGLPLPLVSMGGSSVLVTATAFGMILSVSRYIEGLSSNEA
ncbi:MAG TPA: cell division protein FtsW [Saprospiraceae bacterium]|nr:cell division protein FtsW [Saprospiraceae bacterium]